MMDSRMMKSHDTSQEDEIIVVASNQNGNQPNGSTMSSSFVRHGPLLSSFALNSTNSPDIAYSGSSDVMVTQQNGQRSMEYLGQAQSTPISFINTMPTAASAGITAPEIARTGGRRSRGMRHRGGGVMLGGSMSVFSVRPDGPRTPTARARGSVRSKPSRLANGSGKRKRSNDNASSDSESSENFTPTSQSRSGRKIIQVSHGSPLIKIEDEPKASPKANEKISPNSRNTIIKAPERKKSSSKRTPGGASAVCKNCGRLHSPESNAMVFCDGCNTGWHQHCHDPPIPQDIVLIESKEWFCTDCIVLKEEKSRLQGKVSGQHMSLLEKRKHLQTLSPKELVSLLLHACSVHPDLPIFNSSDGQTTNDDLFEDEDILPYPKPGNGIALPPERDHLHLLLDDDTDVYSHCTSGIAQLVAAARANLLRNGTISLKA